MRIHAGKTLGGGQSPPATILGGQSPLCPPCSAAPEFGVSSSGTKSRTSPFHRHIQQKEIFGPLYIEARLAMLAAASFTRKFVSPLHGSIRKYYCTCAKTLCGFEEGGAPHQNVLARALYCEMYSVVQMIESW